MVKKPKQGDFSQPIPIPPPGDSKKSESWVNLLIVTRPTLDSREGLMRIMQREMRQVMVFKRMKEKSRSSREVVPGQEEIRLSEMVGTCTY